MIGNSLTSKMMLTPPRGPFSVKTRVAVIKEGQRKQCLVVTLDLIDVVDVTLACLDVVKDIVLTQAAVADDVYVFDDSLWLLWLSLLG